MSCLPYVCLSIALSWHQPWHGSRGITHNADGSQTQNTEWKAYAHHCTVERHLRHKHWGEIYIHSAVERDLKLLSVKPPANTNTVEGSLKMYKIYTCNAHRVEWSTYKHSGGKPCPVFASATSFQRHQCTVETAGGPCLRPQQSKCWKEDLKTLLQQEQAWDRLDVCPTLQMSPI